MLPLIVLPLKTPAEVGSYTCRRRSNKIPLLSFIQDFHFLLQDPWTLELIFQPQEA